MLRPLHDYIVVRPIQRKQSDVIEVISHEKHCRGEILAVGPGKVDKKGRRWPLDAKVGQFIIFGNGDFDFYPKVTHNGETYRLIQEADIVGLVEPEEADVRMAA